jgi:molecular chaperone GrpE
MADREEHRAAEGEGTVEQQEAPSGDATELRAQLDEARSLADEERRKAATYLDLAQRSQADFQNYKRRVEQERDQLVKDANAELLRQILPVLDDLERALANMPGELAQDNWATGVALIGQKLQGILEQRGLSRIGLEGEPFDPYIHEAVAYEEHPEYGEGQVAGVYRPGYRLHERVLRPAQVTVARAPATGSPARDESVSSPAHDEEPRPTRGGRQRARGRTSWNGRSDGRPI